ncbi:ABC transporter substrate-binding protein [Actinomadura soli]|uniref:ABC transporter substrate-binding protein n=1 Tax=Actinomadura soli TaxID=2508997 RepID=A0A5C4JG76_9ACTN|nr:ABC transporter substrate-binding protein [Actinomadura soli]TMR04917.1 ABC transporter substrate-binding protein [Actinomadura soli]
MARKLPPLTSSTRAGYVRKAWLPVAFAMFAGCVACSPSSGGSPANGRSGTQLVWGKAAEADVLDPPAAGNATSWELLHLTYENLVGLDDKLKIVPELAKSWRQVSPTKYVFELREGVKFSNGRQMTADDVVGSLKRLIDPATASIWAGQVGIRGVTATGDGQVEVTLLKPKTPFLAALAGSPAAVLPMKELSDGTFDPKKELLGTGPFKAVAHSQAESWTFERNPHYWRSGLPKAGKLTVRIMPDDAARAAALRDGSVDFTSFEAPDSVRLLQGRTNVKTVVQATSDYYRVDVNARSSIFSDDRLRQALALSIDRERIKNVALGGVGRASAAVPPAFAGVCDPATVPLGKPDAQRARQLVAEAGATGKTVEINTISQVAMSSPIAQVIQQSLQAAGLKVRIVPLDLGAAMKRAYSGGQADFDVLVSWSAGYADPAMDLAWYHPELVGFNKGFVKPDPQLYSLIDGGLAAAPDESRTRMFGDACDRIAQNANIIPLVTKEAIVAYRSDKATVSLMSVEGYGLPLRRMADFGVK